MYLSFLNYSYILPFCSIIPLRFQYESADNNIYLVYLMQICIMIYSAMFCSVSFFGGQARNQLKCTIIFLAYNARYSRVTSHYWQFPGLGNIMNMFIWSCKDNIYDLETLYQCNSNISIYIGFLQLITLNLAFGNIYTWQLLVAKILR